MEDLIPVGSVEELVDTRCLALVLAKWRARYTVVYGSVTRAEATSVNDVDIGVKISHCLGFRERGLLYVELEECLRRGRRLDLAFLDDRDPILLWEALSKEC